MKDAVGKIVTLIIVLAIGYWLVSGLISGRRVEREKKAAKVEEQEAKVEKQLQIKKSVEDIIIKHNAVLDWFQQFDNEDIGLLSSPPIYTIQIEEALIRTDTHPVMIFAHVEDVVKSGTEYSVSFSIVDLFSITYSYPCIRFVLNCSQDQVNLILQNHKKEEPFELANYAVIAQISGVRKVSYELTANADSVIPEDEYSFDVDISNNLEPSNIFMATGRCLDLLFVGDYNLEAFMETTAE